MPLYIRDTDIDALAAKVQEALKVPTKTEAVRLALQHELQRAQDRNLRSSARRKPSPCTRRSGRRRVPVGDAAAVTIST